MQVFRPLDEMENAIRQRHEQAARDMPNMWASRAFGRRVAAATTAAAHTTEGRMIWTWLTAAFVFLAKLIIPAPPKQADQEIDPSQKCPSCGHRDGVIRAIIDKAGRPQVQHTCKVCCAIWNELPVLRTSQPKISALPEAKPELVKPA